MDCNMDSTKQNLLEQQSSSNKNTQKPFILSLIIILTLIVAGILTFTTTAVIGKFTQNTYTYHSPTNTQSIRHVCAVTPHDRLCRSALFSAVFASGDDYISPEKIIILSFQLGHPQLTHLASLFDSTNPNEFPEVAAALRECQALLSNSVSELNESVTYGTSLHSLSNGDVNDYLEKLRKIERRERACLDKLEMSGSTVVDRVRLDVQKWRKYMENTKAILVNIDGILGEIYESPVDYSYNYYVDWLGYEYMVVCVLQCILLILLLILLLKPY